MYIYFKTNEQGDAWSFVLGAEVVFPVLVESPLTTVKDAIQIKVLLN